MPRYRHEYVEFASRCYDRFTWMTKGLRSMTGYTGNFGDARLCFAMATVFRLLNATEKATVACQPSWWHTMLFDEPWLIASFSV
ncbi:hypothetical protein J7T55_001073 [Diaporthe amygdali]|uniref:uncharacterized protein n=1 Tax=Phomopsis amygdali TaxID=1214568 RepID=UPI0022FDE7CA|nr:uncharacterized protein J7T55_001073 [Diaporthe amygdali]KAJ0120217.1 hypothetical protein J7T55_001073 [Diaporthe amygdali]